MAVTAIKSTAARRSAAARSTSTARTRPADDSSKKKNPPPRRSKSVSAVSRSHPAAAPPSSSSSAHDLSVFSNNTRENPLYGCSSSSSPDSDNPSRACPAKKTSSIRNLSRPAIERCGRSVSRGTYGFSESDVDCGYLRSTSSTRNKEAGYSGGSSNELNVLNGKKNLHRWTSKHSVNDAWETTRSCARDHNLDDGEPTGCLSESEEATIRDFCEQMKSDLPVDDEDVATSHDIGPSKVWRTFSELKSDLESSYERARKLREDLAVEEQREQELSRILKEMLPNRKRSLHKIRSRRKASIERLQMSRCLTEEALSYFDECVSISTFDSTEFSPYEEAPHNFVDGALNSSTFHASGTMGFSTSHYLDGHLQHQDESDNQTQCSLNFAESDLGASSNCSGSICTVHNNDLAKNCDGSVRSESASASAKVDFLGIRNYVKKFERETKKGGEHVRIRYNADDYRERQTVESLLLERVVNRRRIEAGTLLVCDLRTF